MKGELGLELGMDNGTLTPLLKRLQSAGLVTRTRDQHDERRVLIDLTSEFQRWYKPPDLSVGSI